MRRYWPLKNDAKMKRRNFIFESGRWLLLGGLVGTSGFLLYRRQFGDPDNCFKNPFCGSCNKFGSCSVVAGLTPEKDERQQGK
jgi:hypothetical protein